jgi:uroporphyrinogen-III decarboxylase
MAGSGAQCIAVDECMSLEVVGETAQQHGIGFIGNFHTTAVLFEEREASQIDAQRCLQEGARFPGYVFGLGAPLTQHINPAHLTEAIAVVRSHGTSIP